MHKNRIMTFLALMIGLLIGGLVFYFYSLKKQKKDTKDESIVLLENIRTACKVISVEGDFTDIHNHTDEKGLFFDVFKAKKKALIIIKATAYVGFDLTKATINVDSENRIIYISDIPQPEILNIETDADFYDITESTFNEFSANELTNVLKKAKLNIIEQVHQSKLINLAKKQGLEVIELIKLIAKSSDYTINITSNQKSLTNQKALKQSLGKTKK